MPMSTSSGLGVWSPAVRRDPAPGILCSVVTTQPAPSPASEVLAEALADLVVAATREEEARAAEILGRIGQPRVDFARRQSVSTVARVAIHRRDSWTCRYCRARTIAPPVLR